MRGPARLCCAQCVGMALDLQRHGPVGGESKSPSGEVSRDHRGVSSHPQHHPPRPPPPPSAHKAPPSRPAEAVAPHQRWGSTCPQVQAPASLGGESSLEGAGRAGLNPQAGSAPTWRGSRRPPGRAHRQQDRPSAVFPQRPWGLATRHHENPAQEGETPPRTGQRGADRTRDVGRPCCPSAPCRGLQGSQPPPCSLPRSPSAPSPALPCPFQNQSFHLINDRNET